MSYQKGMPRFHKGEDGYYRPMSKGGFYKAGDGKMYAMSKADLANAGEGMNAPAKDDDDDDDNGDDKKGGYKKSAVTVDDFQKSLDELESLAKAGDTASRKDELLQKAMSGELDDEERDFLFKALGGDVAVEEDPKIVDDITKSFHDSEPIQKALDVSEYLQGQHEATIDALSALGGIIEKSETRQHNFNLVLAKAVHQTGELMKAISHRLGVIESQPAHAPRSRGVPVPAGGRAMEKSFGGEGLPSEQLSKSEILDGLEQIMQKSHPDSSEAQAILHETAKYEQTNQISKAMLAKVMEHRQNNAH